MKLPIFLFLTSLVILTAGCSVEKVDEPGPWYSEDPFPTNDMFPNTAIASSNPYESVVIEGTITDENQKDAYKFYGKNGLVKYITLACDSSLGQLYVELYDPTESFVGAKWCGQQLNILMYYDGWYFVRVAPDEVYHLPINYTLTLRTP